ncbi:UNVERIFIED_CONTAM: hypothetical protein GTU68_040876 [Idotea baltica]|nr:hypothetical protein [Idotea baltica]
MTTLVIGDKAPAFKAQDQNDNTVQLKDFKGKKLILFFYPKDNTPGCTKEACNLKDNYSALQKAGYEILGISPDPAKSHLKFIDKYSLPFSLLVDTDLTIANAYGIWGEKKFMGKVYDGIHRTTFVIDEKGKLENVITKVKTADHAAQIIS